MVFQDRNKQLQLTHPAKTKIEVKTRTKTKVIVVHPRVKKTEQPPKPASTAQVPRAGEFYIPPVERWDLILDQNYRVVAKVQDSSKPNWYLDIYDYCNLGEGDIVQLRGYDAAKKSDLLVFKSDNSTGTRHSCTLGLFFELPKPNVDRILRMTIRPPK